MNDTSSAPVTMKIDVVSDVVCPWCAIGLNSLERALERLQPEVQATLHLQPFELNPQLAPEGEDLVQHLGGKYGISAAQIAQNQQAIAERGRSVGFRFGERTRIHNTFDAHRLLHWAGEQGAQRQLALKHALLQAYHGEGRDVSDTEVLVDAARQAGLEADAARAVLASGAHAEAVRELERYYQQAGISAVPAFVINDRHLISGGQPVEVFERALRQLANEARGGTGTA
jgi:predicted DsbA family dithiol-disulfide isomerase